MGYQFIHIEAYAREGSQQSKTDKKTGETSKTKKHSAADIAGEAERKKGHCDHVAEPKVPNLLYGVTPSEAVAEATAWAENEKDAQGRKLRKDALCMLAGVVSIGNESADFWDEHKQRTISWLKHKYGDRLKSVIEHTDEEHPHLHFYCVAKAGERFEVLHDGYKAAAEEKRAGELKGRQNAAYIKAMQALQDSFYMSVASKIGLARLGPKVQRLKRGEWKAQKNARRIEAQARRRDKKIKVRAYREGFDKGYGDAAKNANSLGAQIGGVLDGLKGGWHAPSKRVEEEKSQLERKIKEQNKRAQRKIIEQEALIKSQEEELRRYKQRELEEKQAEEKRLRADQKSLAINKINEAERKLKLDK
ncbi:plasmid recombination protein [Paracidovorax avenae]|uniref:plasmid recombination protein n=1 Tax=Paracidovorax avenae TaxID=80867 RepID=UPI001AD817F9|nr:plasmid recombination protein [Paracidovorax avenae]